MAVINGEEENEHIVGFGYLNTNAKFKEPSRIPVHHKCDLQIESLYISINYHRLGIGQKLMQEMEHKALIEGCSRVGILSSMPAVSFYERIRYLIVEKRWFKVEPDKIDDLYCNGMYSILKQEYL